MKTDTPKRNNVACNRIGLLQLLFAAVVLILFTHNLTAQYTALYSFLSNGDNNMRNPYTSEPLVNGTILYGMTPNGGNNNGGVIFKMNTDGSNFQKLHDFTKTTGISPYGSLSFADDSLCGMTYEGGVSEAGVIFKMNVNGSGYRCLHQFTSGSPRGKLIQLGDSLYGMTSKGGTASRGSIFKIHKSGKGFKELFSLPGTNGSAPYGSLTLVGDSLYGTTMYGGVNNVGVIFKIHRNGTGYKKVFDFSSANGSYPWGSLTLLGDSLYGMTGNGGVNNYGVIFRIHKNSSGFKKLMEFSAETGFNPNGSLTAVGDSLYGMTYYDNYYYQGIVFKIHKSGSGYQKLVTFNGAEKGGGPRGSLTLSGTTLYGMTQYGGASANGVIFKIEKDGSGFAKLKDCYDIPGGGSPNSVITDGQYIYGTTYEGGTKAYGTIYKTKIDGSGFQQLYSFNMTNGAFPYSALLLLGDSLYGTTYTGGGYGAIFRINTNGNGFKRIYNFNSTDGANPRSSLVLLGDSLYGTTNGGGTSGNGVVYKVHKNGSGYKAIHKFNNTNGRYPYGALTQVGDSLYGMTRNGGSADRGVIFKIHRSGNGFQKLFDFNTSTGIVPEGSLTLAGDSLYGMTAASNNYGVIFKIHRKGTGYTMMHEFEMTDGITPRGSLTLLGNDLYGLTSKGADNNYGSLFKINIKTGVFTKLRDLEVNTGANPEGSLFAYNNELYGSCPKGGTNGLGVVFKYKPVTVQATNIQVSNKLATQMNIGFTAGDGTSRAVFMSQGNSGTPAIVNNTTYTASSVFGSGSQAGAGWYCVARGSGTSLTVSGLTANTNYRVMVIEYIGESGEEYYMTTSAAGNPANTATIGKLAQTITFGTIPVKVYGDADFAPGATVNSGLNITYTSSNPAVATIVNGKIHIAGVGSSIITATQNGNSNYNAATSTDQALLVNKANQAITFPDLPVKVSGDADFSPGATASSGLAVAYSSSNTAVATIVGDKIHIAGPGTCEITASQIGSSNFNAAINVVKTFTVKSTQTITFPAIPVKKTGNADFNPGATASSGLPITYTSSNTSVATIVGGLIHLVGTGTSNITASQPGNTSFTAATDVVQVLTVNQTTAVTDLNSEDILIYPVPASDKISVKIPADKIARIEIISITGQVTHSKTQTSQLEVMDISRFAKGIYTIKITMEEDMIIKKVEIQ